MEIRETESEVGGWYPPYNPLLFRICVVSHFYVWFISNMNVGFHAAGCPP